MPYIVVQTTRTAHTRIWEKHRQNQKRNGAFDSIKANFAQRRQNSEVGYMNGYAKKKNVDATSRTEATTTQTIQIFSFENQNKYKITKQKKCVCRISNIGQLERKKICHNNIKTYCWHSRLVIQYQCLCMYMHTAIFTQSVLYSIDVVNTNEPLAHFEDISFREFPGERNGQSVYVETLETSPIYTESEHTLVGVPRYFIGR